MEEMQKLIITIGLPASGKTTFAKKWVNENPYKRIRVCRDEIRKMMGPSTMFTNKRESIISKVESALVRDAIKKGYDVIIDAHHLNPKVVSKWTSYVKMVNSNHKIIDFEMVRFNVSLDECIRRDNKRPGDEQIGEEIIRKIHSKYMDPILKIEQSIEEWN